MNGRKLIVLLLATLALAAAGCGGDDNSEASGDTDTTVVEETTTEETTTEETTTEDEASADETTLSGKCVELAGIGAKFSQAASGGNAGLEEISKLFDELAANVPDEIKDDFQVLADNYAKLAEATKGIDLSSGKQPSAEDLAKMQEVTSSLNSPEIQEASKNIQDWATKNC